MGQSFYDDEARTLPVVYVDRSSTTSNSSPAPPTGGGRGLVYVTRDDPDGSGGVLPAVRLRNAREIPAGLTFAFGPAVLRRGQLQHRYQSRQWYRCDAVNFLSSAGRTPGRDQRQVAAARTYTAVHDRQHRNHRASPGYAGQAEYNESLNVFVSGEVDRQTVIFHGSIIDLRTVKNRAGRLRYRDPPPLPRLGYNQKAPNKVPTRVPKVFGQILAWKEKPRGMR